MNCKEQYEKLRELIHIQYAPNAYKRLETDEELYAIEGVEILDDFACMYCQIPYFVKADGKIVGLSSKNRLVDRCKRTHGLMEVTEEGMLQESQEMSNTWMPSVEEAMKQQACYPRIPTGQALVVGPLNKVTYEPDVILVYGNPAQLMYLMCGIQKIKYELFEFTFIGEGSCTDSLAKCYVTKKPALSIPCFGERASGTLSDEELIIGLTPEYLDRAIEGMEVLKSIGFQYPFERHKGSADQRKMIEELYALSHK